MATSTMRRNGIIHFGGRGGLWEGEDWMDRETVGQSGGGGGGG